MTHGHELEPIFLTTAAMKTNRTTEYSQFNVSIEFVVQLTFLHEPNLSTKSLNDGKVFFLLHILESLLHNKDL